jgi:hypothetical protein
MDSTFVNATGNSLAHGGNAAEAAAWADRAEELAAWAWPQVNRTDVWGGYHPVHRRGKKYRRQNGKVGIMGPATTMPLPSRRGKDQLGLATLVRHFRATSPEHLVGLHTTSYDNLSRWGAIELDQHAEAADAASAEANLQAIMALYGALERRFFRPLLTDSNGKGGFHLRALLEEPVPTPQLFAFLQALIRECPLIGPKVAAETFPKQARVGEKNCCFGNWLRLTGRHHTREHYSRVWDGRRWLAGADAVDFLLTFHGDPVGLVPVVGQESSRVIQAEEIASTPSVGGKRYVSHIHPNGMVQLPNRIVRAIRRCVPAGPGQRNARIMDLVTALKAPGEELPPEVIDAAFRLWWRMAEQVVNTKDVRVSWNDYDRAWRWEPPEQQGLNWPAILAAIENEALPPAFDGWSWPARQLARLLAVIQRHNGNRPFFLSCQHAEARLAIGHTTAGRTLKRMQQRGLLELVEKGTQKSGRASTYRCRWL